MLSMLNPSVQFDFAGAVLDPRITFTRAGNTATVVDSSGRVSAINADLPRFNYNPVTLACNGLLIEEQRSNSILSSQDLRASTEGNALSVWTGTSATTVTANAGVSPSGANDASKVAATATTAAHTRQQTVEFVSGSSSIVCGDDDERNVHGARSG